MSFPYTSGMENYDRKSENLAEEPVLAMPGNRSPCKFFNKTMTEENELWGNRAQNRKINKLSKSQYFSL